MGKDYINKTLDFYSFKRPSFMQGMARLLDFAGSIRSYKIANPKKTDYQALKSDWEMVGRDLDYAIKQYDRNFKSGK